MSTPNPGPIDGYSHGHQPSVLASHAARSAANSCAYFLDRLQPGHRVLDLGCGPGTITLDLAGCVSPNGVVLGVDASPDAIRAARQNAAARGDNVTEFMIGDLFNLPLESGSFDVVHAHQVLQHLTDPVGALATMATFCKPGGIIAVRDADYAAMVWHPEFAGLTLWRETYSAGARASGAEPDAGRRLREWANAARLDVVFAGSSTWTYATAETTSWWGNSQADRVVASNFTVTAKAMGLTDEQIGAIADDWRAWGAHPDATFLMPHYEIIVRKPA